MVTSLHTVCIRRKDGPEVVGRVARSVTYTWWLLGLAVKGPWLGPGGPPLAQTSWTGLENTTHLVGVVGVGVWQGRLLAF